MTLAIDLKQSPLFFMENPFGVVNVEATQRLFVAILGSFFAYTSWPGGVYKITNSPVLLSDRVEVAQEKTYLRPDDYSTPPDDIFDLTLELPSFKDNSVGEYVEWAGYMGYGKDTYIPISCVAGDWFYARTSGGGIFFSGSRHVDQALYDLNGMELITLIAWSYWGYVRPGVPPYSLAIVFYLETAAGMVEVYRHTLQPGYFVKNFSLLSSSTQDNQPGAPLSAQIHNFSVSFETFRVRCASPLVVDGRWLPADTQSFTISYADFNF